MLQDLWDRIVETLTPLLDFLNAILLRLRDRWQGIFIVIWLLALAALAAWAGWSLASLNPQCEGHWHHVTVPITVNGQQGTEDKWVCQ